MSRAANLLYRAGILPEGVATQARRWGVDVEEPDELVAELGLGYLQDALDEVLQGHSFREQVTDPDLYTRFLTTQRPAMLVLVDVDLSLRAEVYVGRHLDGAWLLPWDGDDVSELLTNGESHLEEGGVRYFFRDVEEFYYGDRKAFLRCIVSTEEPHGDSGPVL